jgi:hypothetical protein
MSRLAIALFLTVLIVISTWFKFQCGQADAKLNAYTLWRNTTRVSKPRNIDEILKIKCNTQDFGYLKELKKDCGKLCDTSRVGATGPYFDYVTAPVDCEAIFLNNCIDAGHGKDQAPRTIPKQLMKYYSMNGKIKVGKYYFDQKYHGGKAKVSTWTKEEIELQIRLAKRGKLKGTYSISETNALRDGLKHAKGIKGGRVLVIGSERPWVEACVLEAGAHEVITLEYGAIISQHPNVKTMTPKEFRVQYLKKKLGQFDAVVTFSSVEHSGLGRYGDALNPWGDILAIARGWCVTRDRGSLVVGVMYGHDSLSFNAHRYYGSIRYPYLTQNWAQKYRGRGSQKVHVFERTEV